MKKVLFIGGGSIGHIAPAVAVAQELKKHANIDCYFVCGIHPNETAFIKKYKFASSMLPFIRRNPIRALIQSYKILSDQKPDLIFSKGTSISIPLCLLAYIKGIPIILHESDAVMGRANWLISKIATHVCFGIGNPIREEITQGSREEGLKITKFSGQKPILLVLGGSQGAKVINEIVWNKLEELLHIVDVAHITGPGKRTACNVSTGNGYWSTEFAYEELPHLYAIAHCALSRAGANTIAELDANGIPTILVPLRGVGHDHQYQNARTATQSNPLFTHMEQEELEEKLLETIYNVIETACHGERSRTMTLDSATSKITKIILQHLE